MGRSAKKEKPQFKKTKHGSLGEIVDKRRFDKDEERDIQDMTDPLYYENYCGSCMLFETEDCPFIGKVNELTRWKIDINCNKFYD